MRNFRLFAIVSAFSATLIGACSTDESGLNPDAGPAPLAVSCLADQDCDDGVSCTHEICRQDNHECLRVADRGLCASDQACILGEHFGEGGCQTPPPPAPPPAPAPMCPASVDDGVACTIDSCAADFTAKHLASSSLCAPNETCDVTTGCVVIPPPPSCPADLGDGVDCTVDVCGMDFSAKHLPDSSKCPTGNTCDATKGCVAPPAPPTPPPPAAPTATINCASDGTTLTVTIYGPVASNLIGGSVSGPTAIQYGADGVTGGWNLPYPAGDTRAQAAWTNDTGPYVVTMPAFRNGFNLYVAASGGGRWFDSTKWKTTGICHWGDGKSPTTDTKIYH